MTDAHQVEPPAKSKYRQWKDGEIPWDWWKAPEEIARRRRLRDIIHNFYAVKRVNLSEPLMAGLYWLMPWDERNYPGRTRGTRQALNDAVPDSTIGNWLYGRNRAPNWALERLADLVGARARLGLEVEAALRKAIAERPAPKPRGLQIIDPDTGLRKHQFRGGSRPKPEPAK